MKQETFATRLSKLSDAATQGEWDIIVGNDLNLSERDMNLAAYLANRRREILALVEAVELQNRNWHSPIVTEALANLDRAQEGE